MLASALDTITKLIQSPPGQLAAGGVLAGIVWKLFERVEAVLTENTKLEIAVWLLGLKVGQKMGPWHETFAKVFDRVFGQRHLSWKCFRRSALASLTFGTAGLVVAFSPSMKYGRSWVFVLNFLHSFAASTWPARSWEARFVHGEAAVPLWLGLSAIFIAITFTNALPDYLSLLETRWLIHLMRGGGAIRTVAILVLDLVFTCGTALAWNWYLTGGFQLGVLWVPNGSRYVETPTYYYVWLVYPALLTSIWLWLYAGSGFLLKAARRFDIGFDWFNRKFDVEKKPLQSIGLVAGALVAVVYWCVVVVSRVAR